MSIIKGTVEVTLNLSKSTCYFLRTGKCSLSVVRTSPCLRLEKFQRTICCIVPGSISR